MTKITYPCGCFVQIAKPKPSAYDGSIALAFDEETKMLVVPYQIEEFKLCEVHKKQIKGR